MNKSELLGLALMVVGVTMICVAMPVIASANNSAVDVFLVVGALVLILWGLAKLLDIKVQFGATLSTSEKKTRNLSMEITERAIQEIKSRGESLGWSLEHTVNMIMTLGFLSIALYDDEEGGIYKHDVEGYPSTMLDISDPDLPDDPYLDSYKDFVETLFD